MTNKTDRSFSIQNMFVILVLAVFLVFSMLMVVLGAMCYVGLEDKSREVNDQRILHSFVRSSLRSQEENAVVRVENDLLIIENNYDGDVYLHYIYASDGQLRQQFISQEREFMPENGEPICPAGLFAPRLEGNLLRLDMQDGNGNEYTLYETVVVARPEGGRL